MAKRTISDQDFLAIALELFRTSGFEGASLQRLADAAGLEKGSLYHRYPDGKDQIAMAVAADVSAWFQINVFEPLTGTATPKKRVRLVCDHLRSFYANGAKSCITDVLSIPGGSAQLKAALKVTMQTWIAAFANVAKESGLHSAVARLRAEEAILRLQGALVLTRVLGDNAPFERVLKQIPHLLAGANRKTLSQSGRKRDSA